MRRGSSCEPQHSEGDDVTHNGVFKKVILLLILLEEENVAVLARPCAVHIHHLLMVLQLSL